MPARIAEGGRPSAWQRNDRHFTEILYSYIVSPINYLDRGNLDFKIRLLVSSLLLLCYGSLWAAHWFTIICVSLFSALGLKLSFFCFLFFVEGPWRCKQQSEDIVIGTLFSLWWGKLLHRVHFEVTYWLCETPSQKADSCFASLFVAGA